MKIYIEQKVDVDLQCPFCGCAKRWKVPSYFKFMNCPDCQGSVFLSWATGVKGELDENGFYFRGDSPMKFKEQTDEFDLNVKDDEADAILIGSYFVNHGQEFGELESHKVS